MKDDLGNTPIIVHCKAIIEGDELDYNILEALLNAGANVLIRDANNCLPLEIACLKVIFIIKFRKMLNFLLYFLIILNYRKESKYPKNFLELIKNY